MSTGTTVLEGIERFGFTVRQATARRRRGTARSEYISGSDGMPSGNLNDPALADQERPAREQRVVVLVQELQLEAGGDDRAHHGAQAMVPFVRAVVHRLRIGAGVGAGGREHDRLVVEVGVLDREIVVAEDVGERVELGQVEAAGGSDELGHHARPALDVGQPVERTEARVDDLEAAAAERFGGVVDVRLDELGVQRAARREVAGGLDRGAGEVEPGDAGAQARPREGVLAEVALRMHEGATLHVRQLHQLERPQGGAAGDERLHVVQLARDMDRHALVPQLAIDLEPVLGHRRRV